MAFCDMSWKSTEASHETSIYRSIRKLVGKRWFWRCEMWNVRKSRTKCSFWCSNMSRLESLASLVSSQCLWGKLQNLCLSNVSKQVVMSFCVAGVALRDIPTCFKTCQKSFCVAGAILLPRFQTMHRILRGRRSILDVLCCVFSANRIVSAAQSGDKVHILWQW